MKRFSSFAAVLVCCLSFGGFAVGADDEEADGPTVYDKIYEIKPEEFEDQVIETDHFIMNNLLLARARNDYGDDKKLERITFGASLKSRTSKSQEVAVMLAGFDDKKTLLWTSKTSDSMYGRVVESMSDQIRIPQGTLKSTTTIWMRVVVVTSKN